MLCEFRDCSCGRLSGRIRGFLLERLVGGRCAGDGGTTCHGAPSDPIRILFSMKTTSIERVRESVAAREAATERRVDELASLSAHLSAATARWLELVWEMHEQGDSSDLQRFIAWRCGITAREAREFMRVAEALSELPLTRAAFGRGELTFTKVRALTRVATGSSEEGLLELAGALTASQLERALRAYRRVAAEDAGVAHELEYVDYFFDDDGTLFLRARLAAEDGTLLIKALEAARERVFERRRAERAAGVTEDSGTEDGQDEDSERDHGAACQVVEPPRPAHIEALLDLAGVSLGAADEPRHERARVVVHVDAAALCADGDGCCELEDGPLISTETARRLGCDAELVARVERDGLPVSVGRSRRTVPVALRRLLEARDDQTCCFPGCESRRHLQAHHREHWANGGETSLENLVLLCWQHHRLVHEGGYMVEGDESSGIRFRNRHGVVWPLAPPRPPPGRADDLLAGNQARVLRIDSDTNRNGRWGEFELRSVVAAITSTLA